LRVGRNEVVSIYMYMYEVGMERGMVEALK